MGSVSIWINEISLTICACHETIYFMLNFLCYSCSLPIGKKKVKLFSRVRLCDPMTVAYQAPPSMGFSRQEYWNGLPFPSPGDLPDPRMEPTSPALAGGCFTTELPGKQARHICMCVGVCAHAKLFQSCPTLQPCGLQPARLLCAWDSSDKNAGVGYHALLQGIFLTKALNSGLLLCR